MADIKWIKITTDIFNDEKILLMEQMPDADSLIVIWFKLLCMAGKENNYGVFMMRNRMPYTEEMLATIFRRPLNTVRMALATFEAYGMIEIDDDIITIPNWEKHQNIEGMEKIREQTRIRVARHREKQKQALLAASNATSNNNKNVTVTLHNATDKKREEKNRKEEEKECGEDESPTLAHGTYNNVILTEKELQALKTEFSDYQSKIDRLSEYMKSSGKTYDDHYATICMWAKEDAKKGRKEMVPDWMKKPKNAFNGYSGQREYDFDALEKELFEPKTAGNDPEVAAKAEALKKELGGV